MRDRFGQRALAAVLVGVVAGAVGSEAAAFSNEPDGFGEARFGMGVSAVREHFPAMRALLPPAATSAQAPIGLEVFETDGQEVLGLSPCHARFYFGNDELYKIGFDCGHDEALFQRLKERFGAATEKIADEVHWLSDTRAVSVDPRTRRFAFTDRARNRTVQLAIYQTARREPSAEKPPSATGAAPAGPGGRGDAPEFDWFDDGKVLSSQLARLDQAESAEEIVKALVGLTILNAKAVPAVAAYLNHPDGLVFEGAVSNLEDIGAATPDEDTSALRALGAVLDDPDASAERKLRVIEAIMFLREKDGAARELARALADPSVEVRREAAMTIALTRDRTAIPALDRAHQSEADGQTRRILARAIEILGQEKPGKSSPAVDSEARSPARTESASAASP